MNRKSEETRMKTLKHLDSVTHAQRGSEDFISKGSRIKAAWQKMGELLQKKHDISDYRSTNV